MDEGRIIAIGNQLTMNGYQFLAAKTAKAYDDPEKELVILSLGLAGEAGEVADYVKKVVGHGHEMDKTKLALEISDCLWYCSALAGWLGLSLSELAAANLDKLRARYGDEFSKEKSENREPV